MKPLPLLLALLAGPALALDPATCVGIDRGPIESTVFAPAIDLGGGMVAQEITYVESTGPDAGRPVGGRTNYAFCGSDRAVQALGYHAPGPGVPSTAVTLVVEEALRTPEPVTLDELARRIEATGQGGFVLDPPFVEPCGCALFYPGSAGANNTTR